MIPQHDAYPSNPLAAVQDEDGNYWFLRLGVDWAADAVARTTLLTAKPLLVFEFAAAQFAREMWLASN